MYWALTNNLQYHEALFPTIQPNSLVLLASPNPVTGTSISAGLLTTLPKTPPDTLFIIDETYAPVPADSLLPVSHLVLLRSWPFNR